MIREKGALPAQTRGGVDQRDCFAAGHPLQDLIYRRERILSCRNSCPRRCRFHYVIAAVFRRPRAISRLVFALLLAAASCRGERVSAPPPRTPHLFLLSLDTLRRDALGVYAPERPSHTPNLDRLAARGVRFERAFAPIPFTLPSHLSLMTGLPPEVHGVMAKGLRLSSRAVTLAERLHAAGYTTLGVATNPWMDGGYGFDRGFDRYQRLKSETLGDSIAESANHTALELLDAHAVPGKPVFLFIHFLDAHSDWGGLPYNSPEALRADLPTSQQEFCTPDGRCATRFLLAADRARTELPLATLEKLHELYRRGVEYLDGELGALFAALAQRGFLEHALVAVVSDHGEEFREHGRFGHVQIYDPAIAIPLILAFPDARYAGRVIPEVVELADLPATLLELLGLPNEPPFAGRSLAPLFDAHPIEDAVALAREHPLRKDQPERLALRTASHKLIYDLSSGETELYDLSVDPGERSNRAGLEPERVAALRQRLLVAVSERSARARELGAESAGAPLLSPEDEELLRAIGYADP